MRQLLVLFGCVVFLLGLAGCQNASRADSGAEANVEGDGQFPEVMVGVWEADTGGAMGAKWGFKFETDGSISKIIHLLAGPVRLAEGGIYEEGPDPGTYAVFAMGPCEADYSTQTRELRVKIILDYYIMKLPHGQLEGKSHDYFKGPVSADGKTWKAEWLSYGWLEGADPPDSNLIEAHPGKLIFTKIDLNNAK